MLIEAIGLYSHVETW